MSARWSRWRGWGRRSAWLLLALLPIPLPAAGVSRVVSLNLCTDQLLVLLAPHKVAALSPLARDPALSYVAPQAALLPSVRPSAEAVLRLHPDLVLATRFGAQPTVALLAAEGIRIVRLGLPQDFPGIRRQTSRLAALLGVPARGEALIAAMDATLANVPPPRHPTTAIALEPRFFTAGPGTLMHAVLHAAGLTDVAHGRSLSPEALLRNPPDLLVTQQAPEFPSLATAALNLPVLDRIPRRSIPPALTLCAGPFTAQAVALLAQ